MKIEKFIEKAIEGGWKESEIRHCTIHFVHENAINGKKDCFVIDSSYTDQYEQRKGTVNHYHIEIILLDPLAWQAVGKVEGWETEKVQRWLHTKTFDSNVRGKVEMYDESRGFILDTQAMLHWHQMIDALAEGKTIEQFIETLW